MNQTTAPESTSSDKVTRLMQSLHGGYALGFLEATLWTQEELNQRVSVDEVPHTTTPFVYACESGDLA